MKFSNFVQLKILCCFFLHFLSNVICCCISLLVYSKSNRIEHFKIFLFNSTFVCPTEIVAFSERISEFNKIECSIVGCSTDSQYTHLAWMNTDRKAGGIGELSYPLLSDKNMSIARNYGVLDEDAGVPFRGLFIIDKNQNLRQVIINDLPIGRSVDEVLRLVQAIQYTDVNGNVCPVNWKPGSETIVPEPTASLEFFKNTSQNLKK